MVLSQHLRTYWNEGKLKMVKIGYARVSTTDQNLEAQEEQLRAAGCTKLFVEKVSGAKKGSP